MEQMILTDRMVGNAVRQILHQQVTVKFLYDGLIMHMVMVIEFEGILLLKAAITSQDIVLSISNFLKKFIWPFVANMSKILEANGAPSALMLHHPDTQPPPMQGPQ